MPLDPVQRHQIEQDPAMPKLTETQTIILSRALFIAIVNARRDPPDAAQRHEAEQAVLTEPDRIS